MPAWWQKVGQGQPLRGRRQDHGRYPLWRLRYPFEYRRPLCTAATRAGAEGAAYPVQVLTAYYALKELGDSAKGQTVLIHSAAGGSALGQPHRQNSTGLPSERWAPLETGFPPGGRIRSGALSGAHILKQNWAGATGGSSTSSWSASAENIKGRLRAARTQADDRMQFPPATPRWATAPTT